MDSAGTHLYNELTFTEPIESDGSPYHIPVVTSRPVASPRGHYSDVEHSGDYTNRLGLELERKNNELVIAEQTLKDVVDKKNSENKKIYDELIKTRKMLVTKVKDIKAREQALAPEINRLSDIIISRDAAIKSLSLELRKQKKDLENTISTLNQSEQLVADLNIAISTNRGCVRESERRENLLRAANKEISQMKGKAGRAQELITQQAAALNKIHMLEFPMVPAEFV